MNKHSKRAIYLSLWLVLGAFVGTLVGEIYEYFYMTSHNEVLEHSVVFYSFIILFSVSFAAWLGPIAWRKIYIEGLRGKKYIVK